MHDRELVREDAIHYRYGHQPIGLSLDGLSIAPCGAITPMWSNFVENVTCPECLASGAPEGRLNHSHWIGWGRP